MSRARVTDLGVIRRGEACYEWVCPERWSKWQGKNSMERRDIKGRQQGRDLVLKIVEESCEHLS